ncbi:MAG: DNA-3-methyladenine glycosylase [Phycisphaerales bacterium]|nr:DNA-3-methyladenine glycosylase [Phycisphaerales bacterium]
MTGTRWDARRFAVDAETLARRLLGARLVSVTRAGTRVAGVIVETEAYIGVHDMASHAARGRRTARNEAMYARPGTAYVYFTYGMHHCFNVVCGAEGEPAAVLIRALRPEEGLALMRRRRGPQADERSLCAGPGRLCRALAIDRRRNGLDLTQSPWLFIEAGRAARNPVRTARIGVGYAGEWASAPLRWLVRGDPHVSVGVKGGRNLLPATGEGR